MHTGSVTDLCALLQMSTLQPWKYDCPGVECNLQYHWLVLTAVIICHNYALRLYNVYIYTEPVMNGLLAVISLFMLGPYTVKWTLAATSVYVWQLHDGPAKLQIYVHCLRQV